MKKVDVLIVGQGLAGSILGIELEKAGVKVMIMDCEEQNSASKIGAGLYNPITGRKMVKTWMADNIFSAIGQYYDDLESILQTKFHHQLPIYRPFLEVEEQNDWMGKSTLDQYDPFVRKVHMSSIALPGIRDPLGGIELTCSGYVDLPEILTGFRSYYDDKGILIPQLFDFKDVVVRRDRITMRDTEAAKLICCTGPHIGDDPFWGHLKFRPVKGEILDITIEDIPNLIINRSVFMIPKKDFVTVGSTYDHDRLDWNPTSEAADNIKKRLSNIFLGEYRILRQRAGVRPATFDRKPFIGFHPKFQNIGIFNGFGTKGVSLIPYFAKLFVQNIVQGQDIMDDVSVER